MLKYINILFFILLTLTSKLNAKENIMILKLKDGDVKIEMFPDVAPDLKQEFNDLPHERGTISMARSSDPNSANSQFFICFESASYLDRNYTVFGKVIEGMEFVDKIKKGDGPNGSVSEPDKIISFKSE